MNRAESESARQGEPDSRATDNRELFVTTDFRSIPAAEIRPMVGSFSQWLSVVLAHKILRSKPRIQYVIEARRLVKGDAENVPKRIMKQFAAVRTQLELLNFGPSFFATIPAIGPVSNAIMAMSRPDGQIHGIASHVVSKADGKVKDEGLLGFTTWLSDQTSIVTMSPAKLPRPRHGVDRLIVNSDGPEVILKKHRERIRKLECLPVSPADLFAQAESEQERQTEDLLRRRVIRLATPAEVTRIRIDMRV
jgi:hypothetical protein